MMVRLAMPRHSRPDDPNRCSHGRILDTLFVQHIRDAVGHDHAAHRQVARRHALGDRHQVRLCAVVSAPNHSPVRPKPQMTSSETNRMSRSFEDPADFGPVGRGRNDDAAGALDRFGNEGADLVFADLVDGAFEFARGPDPNSSSLMSDCMPSPNQ
jgi:hypothetical protein